MKQYIPYIIVAVLTFSLCALADWLLSKRKKRRAEKNVVRPARRTAVFGTVLLFFGGACCLFLPSRFGWLAIAAGILSMLMGTFMLLVYFGTGIEYDESGFTYRSFRHGRAAYTYGQITGELALLTRGGITVMLQLGETQVFLYESMQGANDFLGFAYSRWCEATGRSEQDCPPPNPGQMAWFPEPEGKES